MNDYVSGEGLGLSEDEANMALVVSTDPLYFEEAVKNGAKRLGHSLSYQPEPKDLE